MTPTGEKDLVHSDVLPKAGDGAVTQLLVERLRKRTYERSDPAPNGWGYVKREHPDPLCQKAADEIERLSAELDASTAAVQTLDAVVNNLNDECARLRSQGGGIPEAMLVAAYKRGCQWCIENGVINNEDPTLTYIDKAAHDYADKVLAAAPPAAQSDADDYIDQLNVLCEDFGCEPGSDRLHWLLEQLSRLKELSASQPPASSWTTELRWVSCESCGGTGEVEVRPNVGPYSDPTPCAAICSACEGTGRFCEEVSPTERDDDALTVPQGVISSAVEAEREACAKVADEYGREGT